LNIYSFTSKKPKKYSIIKTVPEMGFRSLLNPL